MNVLLQSLYVTGEKLTSHVYIREHFFLFNNSLFNNSSQDKTIINKCSPGGSEWQKPPGSKQNNSKVALKLQNYSPGGSAWQKPPGNIIN